MKKFFLCAVMFSAFVSAGRAESAILLPRQPGDRLDASMANEADHCVALAKQWMLARQNNDGSWGFGANTLSLTALAGFALSAFPDADTSNAYAKASAYIAGQSLPCPGFPFGCDLNAGLAPIAAAWPPSAETSAKQWASIVYSINKRNGILLNADGSRIDWPKTAAQSLIGRQKIAQEGGGYWEAAKGQTACPLEETSYALLVFSEL